ncbi:MAG TPA: AAA family ATPase [Flavobacterium sp.]|jgi:KaiC/GvpD/RAD55 family RecA-like ATPase
MDAIKQNENEFSQFNFKITKAKDLILKIQNEPEPEIVWNGIVEGSKGLIVGVSKTGKTTLAENLAISLAVGRKEFFNYPLKGKPEKVLFINLEESFRVRSRRNLKQISILTEDEKLLFNENYYSTPEDFPEFLVTDDNWNYINKYIEEVDPKYVFIDSLSHMFEGQIENSEPAIRFVKRFRTFISSLNKTIIIVHHNTKGNEKPIDQDSIAGSRIIAQEFEYAIGLGNIPTRGGSYLSVLYNKYVEKDDTTAYTYKINSENWVENISIENKYDLYKDVKIDYRKDSTNPNRILSYIQSKRSQDSQTTLTADLKRDFVDNDTKIMSKDTLYKSLDKLVNEGLIEMVKKGEYTIKMKDERELQ